MKKKAEGIIYTGIGGSRKTQNGVETYEKAEGEKIIFSFTNKAVNVIRKRLTDKRIKY